MHCKNIGHPQSLFDGKLRIKCCFVIEISKHFFQNYPFDVQKCGIYLESFKYHIDEMYFSDVSAIAKKEPVDDFVLEGYESVNCTDAENPDAVPCHYIMMTLTRQTGYFILQVS